MCDAYFRDRACVLCADDVMVWHDYFDMNCKDDLSSLKDDDDSSVEDY